MFQWIFGSRAKINKPTFSRRLGCETLESRTLLTTFFVDNADTAHSDLPGDNLYSEVQEAVDAASEGDTIRVSTGRYQPFRVETDGLRILRANDDARPTIDGNLNPGDENGIEIRANRITLAGFTVRNISGEQSLDPTGAFKQFGQGVLIVGGQDNVLKGNVFKNNTNLSIQLENSDNNTIQGNKLNGQGIYFGESSNNRLLNNQVYMRDAPGNSRRHGIHLQESHNNVIRDNFVRNASYAISLEGSSGNKIQSNRVVASFDGIVLLPVSTGTDSSSTGSDRNVINGNYAVDNSQFGIGVIGGNENRVINNQVRRNVRGIVINRGAKNQLIGNTAAENGSDNTRFGAGFEISQTTDMLIANNTSYLNHTHGYWLADSTGVDFVSNIARSNTQQGFKVETSDHNKFRRNTSSANGLNGFLLERSSSNTLTQNVATKNGSQGFDLNRSRSNSLTKNISTLNTRSGFQIGTDSVLNKLTGNEARLNRFSGFHTHGSTGVGNVLRNNVAIGNGQFGFSIGNSDGNLFVGNISRSNDYWGFLIGNFSDNNTFVANTSRANGLYGFQVDDISSNNKIVRNLAISNGLFGFFVETESLSLNTFSDNECLNNGTAGDNQGGAIC